MKSALTVLVALVVVALAAPTAHANESIWGDLRSQDGLVILYRHAIAPGGGDPAGFELGDCSTQRNLSGEGRQQARAIGRELRQERVLVAQVRSSRWCRALDTARLMAVGSVRPTPALDSVFTASTARALKQERRTKSLIRQHGGKAGALVLVGHQANIIDLTGIAPSSGEGVVVRMGDDGRLEVLGRIPAP